MACAVVSHAEHPIRRVIPDTVDQYPEAENFRGIPGLPDVNWAYPEVWLPEAAHTTLVEELCSWASDLGDFTFDDDQNEGNAHVPVRALLILGMLVRDLNTSHDLEEDDDGEEDLSKVSWPTRPPVHVGQTHWNRQGSYVEVTNNYD